MLLHAEKTLVLSGWATLPSCEGLIELSAVKKVWHESVEKY